MRTDGVGGGGSAQGGGLFFNQSMVDAVLKPPGEQMSWTGAATDPALSRPPSFLNPGGPWGGRPATPESTAPQAGNGFLPAASTPPASVTSSPREFLDSLPPNGTWRGGEAPADRMRALSRALGDLQTATMASLHKETASEDDIAQAMSRLQTFQQALAESPVQFPSPGGLNFDGGLGPAMFDSASSYNQGQQDVESAHSTVTSSLQELSKLVQHSLQTPGSSLHETTGGGLLWRAKPVDDVIGGKFASAAQGLTTLMQESARIRNDGNTIVNEGDLGIVGPTLRTTRREGEAPSVSDYLPGVAAGADALFKIFGER